VRALIARVGNADVVDLLADEFERLATLDRFGRHELTTDPVQADVILFTQCHMIDWRLRAIREHPLAREHWNKVMVYDERDVTWRSFPGVYVSTPAHAFDQTSQRAWGYLTTPAVPALDSSSDPDLLFSFVGSNSAPCRRPLLDLRHPDGLVEEVHGFMFWDASGPGFEGKRARYQETLARSRFVLCPRGRGTSSIRLYETLAAGRVPVIISNDWVAPEGPDWAACSLRWPEGRTKGLTEMLAERDRDWPSMSAAASREHDAFFAADATFHRVIDLCCDLRKAGPPPSPRSRMQIRGVRAALGNRVGRGQ
jgi:hypothetical protein